MPKTALLVDDDALFRTAIGDGLRRHGYDVTPAADGLEALERVQEAPPDVIVLDLIMPRLDGSRVCRFLKSHPLYQSIPIIVLTGVAAEAGAVLGELDIAATVAKRRMDATLQDLLAALQSLEAGTQPARPALARVPQDLTQRRIVSELLAERQRLQRLFAAFGEGVVELDAKGRVVYANPAAQRLLRVTESALLGTPGPEILGPGNAAGLAQALEDVCAAAEGHPIHLDVVVETHTFGVTVTSLPSFEEAPGVVLIVRDLTQLTQRARGFLALASVDRNIVGQLDPEGVLREIVSRTLELFAADRVGLFRSDPEADGRFRIRRLQRLGPGGPPPEDLTIAPGQGVLGRALRDQRPVWTEDVSHDAANGLLAVQDPDTQDEGARAVLVAPVLLPNEVFGLLAIHRARGHRFSPEEVELAASLTGSAAVAIQNARLYEGTRKAYEQLKAAQERAIQTEKSRALGEMAAGVAHDFNNRLTAILGRAQLLRRHPELPEPIEDGLAAIERAVLDAAENVRRVLGFARPRRAGAYRAVNVRGLLSQALELTRPRWRDEAQARGISVQAEIRMDQPLVVWGNEAELREALTNLIFNAVEAMPSGGRLTLGARRAAPTPHLSAAGPFPAVVASQGAIPDPSLVEIFVSDTGVGMPDEVRDRAFEPFFTTKDVKGSGLGLSMVYGTVRRHGGEIDVDSRVGMGTTMVLRLPSEAPTGHHPAGGTSTAPSRRIVVLDDEEVLAGLLADILRLHHHQVDVFTSPQRALERIAAAPTDIFFTDLGMPEMSGWDVAREALRLRPELPIVLVTGWGDQIEMTEIQARGIASLVPKPYEQDHILRLVTEILSKPSRP